MILFSSFSVIQSLTQGNLGLRYIGETNSTIIGKKVKSINTMTTGRYGIFIEDIVLWDKYIIFGTGSGFITFSSTSVVSQLVAIIRKEIKIKYLDNLTKFIKLLNQ